MAKSSSIYTRVEPEIKEKAEQVLRTLGIPMANAVNLFLHQIVLQKGIPFEVKIPEEIPFDMSALSQKEIDKEIQKGLDDIEADRMISAAQVRETIESRHIV
jgi:addiction module RelB/DinJ family antitoxin